MEDKEMMKRSSTRLLGLEAEKTTLVLERKSKIVYEKKSIFSKKQSFCTNLLSLLA